MGRGQLLRKQRRTGSGGRRWFRTYVPQGNKKFKEEEEGEEEEDNNYKFHANPESYKIMYLYYSSVTLLKRFVFSPPSEPQTYIIHLLMSPKGCKENN